MSKIKDTVLSYGLSCPKEKSKFFSGNFKGTVEASGQMCDDSSLKTFGAVDVPFLCKD